MIFRLRTFLVLGFLSFPAAAQAVDVSMGISFGSSAYSYEYSHPVLPGSAERDAWSEEFSLGYQELSLHFAGAKSAVSLKYNTLPEPQDDELPVDPSQILREEYAVNYSFMVNKHLSAFAGAYRARTKLNALTTVFDEYNTKITTGGLYGGATYQRPINEKILWYVRGGWQITAVSFSNARTDGRVQYDAALTGAAVTLGGGLYVPMKKEAGFLVGLDNKYYTADDSFDSALPDDQQTSVTERQTNFFFGFSFGF